jgi:hypothetical protein
LWQAPHTTGQTTSHHARHPYPPYHALRRVLQKSFHKRPWNLVQWGREGCELLTDCLTKLKFTAFRCATMPLAIALEDVEGAAKRIEDEAIHTPVMTCRTLNAMSGRCGQCMNLFVLRKLATQSSCKAPAVQTLHMGACKPAPVQTLVACKPAPVQTLVACKPAPVQTLVACKPAASANTGCMQPSRQECTHALTYLGTQRQPHMPACTAAFSPACQGNSVNASTARVHTCAHTLHTPTPATTSQPHFRSHGAVHSCTRTITHTHTRQHDCLLTSAHHTLTHHEGSCSSSASCSSVLAHSSSAGL